MGVPERKERDGQKNIWKKKVSENLQNLVTTIDLCIYNIQ